MQSRRCRSDELEDHDMENQGVRAKRCSRKMRGIENGEERGVQIQVMRSRGSAKVEMETKSQ
jgi:hypothetical protein